MFAMNKSDEVGSCQLGFSQDGFGYTWVAFAKYEHPIYIQILELLKSPLVKYRENHRNW